MNTPSGPVEIGKNSLLLLAAWVIDMLNNHGALLVVVLAIIYGVMQIVFRRREHKAIMTQHKWREEWHKEGKYP